MNNRVLFMIIDNEIKYLINSNMDHKEWYKSLNLDIEEFDNIVRGFVLDNKIVFYKGFFKYDKETIKIAELYYPSIRKYLNNPTLEVYCGVYPGKQGEKWEPIVRIDNSNTDNRFNKDTNIEKQKLERPKEIKEELDPLIEFKNNFSDPKIIKNLLIFTIIISVINLILKIILYTTHTIELSNTLDLILVFIQFLLLGFTIYGYSKKIKNTHLIAVITSIIMILTFNIFDIILGIIYFIITIDQSIFMKIINKFKRTKA